MLPGRMTVERIARLIEGHVVGQLDRQIRGRDRHDAAASQWMIGIGQPQ